jgi:hypothetical protein
LRSPAELCYSSRPASVATEKLNEISQLRWQYPSVKLKRSKKEVDEYRETLHNLISLLLTNTTIRQAQQAVQNTVL